MSTVQRLHDALGFTPPAASDHVREDDLVVIELFQQLVAVDGDPGPGQRYAPTHIGIHCGPVVFQDGDIYGSTVNIAARLSARAAPGEVLVSKPAADRIAQPGRLEPVGVVELKASPNPGGVAVPN